MFSLSALADDLAVLDHHLHEGLDDDPGSPAVTYFRLIVARVYEGERIVTAMDAHATIASFLAGVPSTIDPCGQLVPHIGATHRQGEGQAVARRADLRAAWHLTVHYPQRGRAGARGGTTSARRCGTSGRRT